MPVSAVPAMTKLLQLVERYWGYRELRPLQAEAMQAVLDRRDSLVVLPTGAGKSLCYQAPAVAQGGTTVVISPLIALMKDQVDGLRSCGIAACQLDSSLTAVARNVSEQELLQGNIRLLFVSPERLVQTDLYRMLQRIGVHTFAIDEAHCISHWGHDFRMEYRQLNRLRQHFPNASVHAYTATATEQVRSDICRALDLRDPVVLVGNFDRPNLTYRVLPRHDQFRQIQDVIERHPGEAGIIYCPRRRDVDGLAETLKANGVRALPYHAGMNSEERASIQEEFINESCDVIVATVAFGMGIDRSNVRFVLHTAMPKSLEHYQQEAGRAGRDGLPAECVLLYSGGDAISSKKLLARSAEENNTDPDVLAACLRHLDEIDRYCRGATCRHRALVGYFGQAYENPTCNACDICLGDSEEVKDANIVAQKILSCVARVKNGFGINQIISILRGENTEGIRKWNHQELTTYGLLKEFQKADLRDWIYQLIGQGVLRQSEDEYPKLHLNDGSWEVMRGRRQVRLLQMVRRPKGERPARSKDEEISWEGVDRALFEVLRKLRRDLAAERAVPPYVVFHDGVLREMARVFPSTPERLRRLSGVGEARLRDYGAQFLEAIREHCTSNALQQDVVVRVAPPTPRTPSPLQPLTPAQSTAFAYFRTGTKVDDVVAKLERTRSTIIEYLCEFIRREQPPSIIAWVSPTIYAAVQRAAKTEGLERLKPIYLALGEKVSYDDIRLVVTHLTLRSNPSSA